MSKQALKWIPLVLAAACMENEAPVADQSGRGEDGPGGDAGAACEIPRAHTFAWSYRAGRYPLMGDEAGAGGQAGVAVCSGEVSFTLGHMDQYVDCAAMARVEALDAGVQLVFGDDTILETTDPLTSTPLDEHEAVWVSYHVEEFLDGRNGRIVDERRLEIRDAPGGRLLVFGYGGAIPQSTPAAVEAEIFGASLQADPQCSLDLSTPCFGELRTAQDFIVKSIPEVRLPYGTLTTVEHDDERFAVRISNSVVMVTSGTTLCQDRRPTDSTAFMAIRLND
jgi:hypothetical protein